MTPEDEPRQRWRGLVAEALEADVRGFDACAFIGEPVKAAFVTGSTAPHDPLATHCLRGAAVAPCVCVTARGNRSGKNCDRDRKQHY